MVTTYGGGVQTGGVNVVQTGGAGLYGTQPMVQQSDQEIFQAQDHLALVILALLRLTMVIPVLIKPNKFPVAEDIVLVLLSEREMR